MQLLLGRGLSVAAMPISKWAKWYEKGGLGRVSAASISSLQVSTVPPRALRRGKPPQNGRLLFASTVPRLPIDSDAGRCRPCAF